MTSLFPPFTRRASFRKQPFFYEAGRGVFYKSLGYSSPALNLDFTTGTLDSRITFSRGTNATLTDSTGKITYAPANLLTYSQTFTDAAWGKLNSTVATTTATTAPDGTLTANTMTDNTTSGQHRISQLSLSAFITYAMSVYVKANTHNFIQLLFTSGSGTNGWVTAVANLSNGTISQTGVGANGTLTSTNITSVGNGWYRISLIGSVTTAGPAFRIAMVPAATGNSFDVSDGTVSYVGTTTSLYLWGAQLEPVTYQTTPSTYVATTTAAYYGPRLDYDPVTLAVKGLLVEEARTNLVVNSVNPPGNFTTGSAAPGQFGGYNSSVTMPGGTIAGPDGVSTSMKQVTFGATTSIFGFRASTSNNTVYTFSVWLATASGTFKLKMMQNDTSTWATANVSNEITVTTTPTRYTLTFTTQSTTGLSDIGIGYEGKTPYNLPATGSVYIYGYTLEQGAFATSYIPTTTASVARSADVASLSGTNFSSWYNQNQGTLIVSCSFKSGSLTVDQMAASITDNTFSARHKISRYANAIYGTTNNVTPQADIKLLNTANAGDIIKASYAYKTNDFAGAANGGSVVTDTSGTIPTNLFILGIGYNVSSDFTNGWIQSITYYPRRLSDTQLQALTS